jgi:hypothetical protein
MLCHVIVFVLEPRVNDYSRCLHATVIMYNEDTEDLTSLDSHRCNMDTRVACHTSLQYRLTQLIMDLVKTCIYRWKSSSIDAGRSDILSNAQLSTLGVYDRLSSSDIRDYTQNQDIIIEA